jgi:hypothetical protein
LARIQRHRLVALVEGGEKQAVIAPAVVEGRAGEAIAAGEAGHRCWVGETRHGREATLPVDDPTGRPGRFSRERVERPAEQKLGVIDEAGAPRFRHGLKEAERRRIEHGFSAARNGAGQDRQDGQHYQRATQHHGFTKHRSGEITLPRAAPPATLLVRHPPAAAIRTIWARIAAWLKMPLRRHFSSNFSFGLWIRSSLRPNPTSTESSPR